MDTIVNSGSTVLKANLSYARHLFRDISFVEEFEGDFFICSYDVSR